jgi:hypothetical protein
LIEFRTWLFVQVRHPVIIDQLEMPMAADFWYSYLLAWDVHIVPVNESYKPTYASPATGPNQTGNPLMGSRRSWRVVILQSRKKASKHGFPRLANQYPLIPRFIPARHKAYQTLTRNHLFVAPGYHLLHTSMIYTKY